MIYRMKLQNEPFKQIKKGIKKIEIRLNDEKRKIFEINDYIEFTNITTLEIMFVKITNLYHFESFEKLFNNFDNSILGCGSYEEMYKYYSKEEEKKYGVLGIEIKVLPKVNQVIHNEDNLTLNDANKVTLRAKLIVENNNDEILICHMGVKYFLIGGHIDNDESDEQCLTREVAEESGVTLDFSNILPIASSNYINKDYPKNGDITYTNTNYYAIKYDLVPNIEMQNLTEEEKKENFKLMYIPKNEVINFLENTKEINATLSDTIMAIKVYLNLQK
ncbi:MAG: NUDIX domain-containing protein [Bacilli bacterium]|nr:NUDIX domain-containing protein [Bacilli bacterium]